MIMAHEIQGCLALENSFNRVGLDHVVLVKASQNLLCTLLMSDKANRSPPLRKLCITTNASADHQF